jgi:hypothetical protein
MLELQDWARQFGEVNDKPWLMLGKGPSFTRRHEFNLADFHLMSLNHSIREQHVRVAHMIDIDVVIDCEDVINSACEYLVMPRYPHTSARPGMAPLEAYFVASPALRALDAEGRLVWYNVSTAPEAVAGSPVLQARFFGSEPALAVLGELGARTVRSLGIDGGTGYANAFLRDAALTHLANGQPSFDMQFPELRQIAKRYCIDYRPLIDPLRIYVGATKDEMVPYRVLAQSIHDHSSVPVIVEPLTSVRSPLPRSRANRPRTAFSFARFHIPELAGYRGRAVYLDSDMLVLGDIAELFEHPKDGAWIACTNQPAPAAWQNDPWFKPGRQFSVMVLDCEQLSWRIDDIIGALDRGELSYPDLMFDMAVVPEDRIDDSICPAWNSLEHIDSDTKLVHFTVVPSQPWKNDRNPLEGRWMTAFEDSVRRGAVPLLEVEELVRSGGRHDLLSAFDTRIEPPRPVRNATEVALSAALDEVDRLRSRTLRNRSRFQAARVSRRLERRVGTSGPMARLFASARAFALRLFGGR